MCKNKKMIKILNLYCISYFNTEFSSKCLKWWHRYQNKSESENRQVGKGIDEGLGSHTTQLSPQMGQVSSFSC